jgi:hypothetical protein
MAQERVEAPDEFFVFASDFEKDFFSCRQAGVLNHIAVYRFTDYGKEPSWNLPGCFMLKFARVARRQAGSAGQSDFGIRVNGRDNFLYQVIMPYERIVVHSHYYIAFSLLDAVINRLTLTVVTFLDNNLVILKRLALEVLDQPGQKPISITVK